MERERLIKIIITGPCGVGKTSLIRSVVKEEYNPSYQSTIAVDFKVFTLETDIGERVKCQIWDTAGQERFHSISKGYYRGAHVILFVYDVSNEDSLAQMETFFKNADWLKNSETNAFENRNTPHCVAYLIGNKSDLTDRRVDFLQGRAFAKTFDLEYDEASAKTGDNVYRIFRNAATLVQEYDAMLRHATANKESVFAMPLETHVLLETQKKMGEKKCC